MNQASTQVKLKTIGEVGLSYRTTRLPYTQVSCSQDTVNFLRQIWDKDKIEHVESFYVLSLNSLNEITSYMVTSSGGSSKVIADVKIIFQKALKVHASAIIVAHNHPSGNLNPSASDMSLTRKLLSASMIMDIPLLDHIILTKTSHLSFSDEKLI